MNPFEDKNKKIFADTLDNIFADTKIKILKNVQVKQDMPTYDFRPVSYDLIPVFDYSKALNNSSYVEPKSEFEIVEKTDPSTYLALQTNQIDSKYRTILDEYIVHLRTEKVIIFQHYIQYLFKDVLMKAFPLKLDKYLSSIIMITNKSNILCYQKGVLTCTYLNFDLTKNYAMVVENISKTMKSADFTILINLMSYIKFMLQDPANHISNDLLTRFTVFQSAKDSFLKELHEFKLNQLQLRKDVELINLEKAKLQRDRDIFEKSKLEPYSKKPKNK